MHLTILLLSAFTFSGLTSSPQRARRDIPINTINSTEKMETGQVVEDEALRFQFPDCSTSTTETNEEEKNTNLESGIQQKFASPEIETETSTLYLFVTTIMPEVGDRKRISRRSSPEAKDIETSVLEDSENSSALTSGPERSEESSQKTSDSTETEESSTDTSEDLESDNSSADTSDPVTSEESSANTSAPLESGESSEDSSGQEESEESTTEASMECESSVAETSKPEESEEIAPHTSDHVESGDLSNEIPEPLSSEYSSQETSEPQRYDGSPAQNYESLESEESTTETSEMMTSEESSKACAVEEDTTTEAESEEESATESGDGDSSKHAIFNRSIVDKYSVNDDEISLERESSIVDNPFQSITTYMETNYEQGQKLQNRDFSEDSLFFSKLMEHFQPVKYSVLGNEKEQFQGSFNENRENEVELSEETITENSDITNLETIYKEDATKYIYKLKKHLILLQIGLGAVESEKLRAMDSHQNTQKDLKMIMGSFS